MFTKRKVIIALTLVFGLGVTLWAQGPGGHFRGRRAGFGGEFGGMDKTSGRMLTRFLDLTEDQQAQINPILEAARSEAQPIREEMKQAREALKTAIESGDEFAVDSLATQIGDLTARSIAIHAKTGIQLQQTLAQVLTPEQAEKLEQLKQLGETRREMMESFRGSRRRPGGETGGELQ